ncbi:HigA family addiction module antitoxin [Pseudomonas sp. ZT5P21]
MKTNGMRPIHPGEILEKELLEPLGISVSDLSFRLCLAEDEVSELVAQTRAVNPDIAKKLTIYLNTTPDFWLNLQSTYDLRRAEIERG